MIAAAQDGRAVSELDFKIMIFGAKKDGLGLQKLQRLKTVDRFLNGSDLISSKVRSREWRSRMIAAAEDGWSTSTQIENYNIKRRKRPNQNCKNRCCSRWLEFSQNSEKTYKIRDDETEISKIRRDRNRWGSGLEVLSSSGATYHGFDGFLGSS